MERSQDPGARARTGRRSGCSTWTTSVTRSSRPAWTTSCSKLSSSPRHRPGTNCRQCAPTRMAAPLPARLKWKTSLRLVDPTCERMCPPPVSSENCAECMSCPCSASQRSSIEHVECTRGSAISHRLMTSQTRHELFAACKPSSCIAHPASAACKIASSARSVPAAACNAWHSFGMECCMPRQWPLR